MLTLGYAAVVFGTMIGLVLVAVLVTALLGDKGALKPKPGAAPGSIEALPPALAEALGYSMVAAYVAGWLFTVVLLRLRAGRTWASQIGLNRLPSGYLLLAVIAFPAFSVGSDLLAQVVDQLFGASDFQAKAGQGLGDLLRGFPWWFAVFAVGVCPGVAEEMWCRGFLGRGLVARYGPWLGVLSTSVFFGLLHVYPFPYVLLTAVMGAGLHFTYLMSRSLWVPISIHLLNNSLAALAAVGMLPATPTEPTFGIVGLTVGGLLFSGLALAAGRNPARRGETVAAAVSAAGCSGVLVWLLAG